MKRRLCEFASSSSFLVALVGVLTIVLSEADVWLKAFLLGVLLPVLVAGTLCTK